MFATDFDDCAWEYIANDNNPKHLVESLKNEEWGFCGVVITAKYNGVDVGNHLASLWGIELNYPESAYVNPNTYLRQVANNLLVEALRIAQGYRSDMIAKLTA